MDDWLFFPFHGEMAHREGRIRLHKRALGDADFLGTDTMFTKGRMKDYENTGAGFSVTGVSVSGFTVYGFSVHGDSEHGFFLGIS